MDYQDVLAALPDLDDDNDNEKLEKAVEFYCSMYDKREGLKYALAMTIRDQYENHALEQDPNDLKKIIKILDLE